MPYSITGALLRAILLAAGLMLNLSPPAHASPEHILQPNSILLAGKIIQMTSDVHTFDATLEVFHVYWDPDNVVLSNIKISGICSDDWHGLTISPPLQLGQQGLWALRRMPDGRFLNIVLGAYGGPSPCRQGIERDYPQRVQLAQIVEQVCHAKQEDQQRMLRQEVVSTSPQVSQWAIQALSSTDDPSVPAYLIKNLLDRKIMPENEISADNALSLIQGKTWTSSQDRLTLFHHWVSAENAEGNSIAELGCINTAALQGDINQVTRDQLLTEAMNNQHLPSETQKLAARLLKQQIRTM